MKSLRSLVVAAVFAGVCVLLLVSGGRSVPAVESGALLLKTEHFDRDPGWDWSNNRVEASDPPTVTQDFGWSPGRIGGTVWKSTTPAWYGMPLKPPLSFKDGFSASGKISVTRESFEKGIAYLGFFNHERQGWRPWSSMALRLVNAGDKAFIYVDYMTGKWNAGAAEMELTIPTDGSEHTRRLTYDPNATRASKKRSRARSLCRWMAARSFAVISRPICAINPSCRIALAFSTCSSIMAR